MTNGTLLYLFPFVEHRLGLDRHLHVDALCHQLAFVLLHTFTDGCESISGRGRLLRVPKVQLCESLSLWGLGIGTE